MNNGQNLYKTHPHPEATGLGAQPFSTRAAQEVSLLQARLAGSLTALSSDNPRKRNNNFWNNWFKLARTQLKLTT